MNINRTDKNLVILSTAFGTNFSGGSLATHEIFCRLENRFGKVFVVCNRIGNHSFRNIEFLHYRNFPDAIRILQSLSNQNSIFYGDFYNAIWLAWLNKPFFFTYHDNWPEQSMISLKDKIRSFFYIPAYHAIFRKSRAVFTVSRFKTDYVRKFNPDVHLIRNGYMTYPVTKKKTDTHYKMILMVGNIDHRKYGLAVKLFELFKKQSGLKINIYGNIIDRTVSRKLASYPFVEIKGFRPEIPFPHYDLFLHTASIENLPMSICEAIHHKLPVAAFDTGGISEVVNEHNGVLVRPYDLKSMHSCIKKILDHEIEFDFSSRVLSQFNWDIAAEKYLNVLLG